MPVGSGAILSGAALSMDTASLPIKNHLTVDTTVRYIDFMREDCLLKS